MSIFFSVVPLSRLRGGSTEVFLPCVILTEPIQIDRYYFWGRGQLFGMSQRIPSRAIDSVLQKKRNFLME